MLRQMKQFCQVACLFVLIYLIQVKASPINYLTQEDKSYVCEYFTDIKNYCMERKARQQGNWLYKLEKRTIPTLKNYLVYLKGHYEEIEEFNEKHVNRSLDEALTNKDLNNSHNEYVLQKVYKDLVKTGCYLNKIITDSEHFGYCIINSTLRSMLTKEPINFNAFLCDVKMLVENSAVVVSDSIEIKHAPRLVDELPAHLRKISDYTVVTTLLEYLDTLLHLDSIVHASQKSLNVIVDYSLSDLFSDVVNYYLKG